jgi:GT2 family glycosyltransferase
MSRTAVSIVSWNTRDLLRRCLESVLAERPAAVVVVDNGSTDGSAEMVRTAFPAVRLEIRPDNPGYGTAANDAIAACRAEHVLLLNGDTEVRPGCLGALGRALDAHPEAGVVGPRVLNPDGSLQRSCFAFPGPFVPLIKRQPLASLTGWDPRFQAHYIGNWDHETARPVPWVLGAALAIRRAAFDAVGGFDAEFPMYFEEVDLCYRLRAAGWEVRFTPEAEVVHVGGASTRQRRAEMIAQLTLSAMAFHRRHRRGPMLALALGTERLQTYGRLVRDGIRYSLTTAAERERLAQNLAAWRRVLASRSAAGS